MRLNRRRQPDLFEGPPNQPPIPSHRRQATVESLRALLTEALSSEASIQIRKEARMKAWMESRLDDLDLLAIQIDGIHMDEDMLLVAAIGVDANGDKHPLGLVEGATENATTVQALIDNLVERGLDLSPIGEMSISQADVAKLLNVGDLVEGPAGAYRLEGDRHAPYHAVARQFEHRTMMWRGGV
jgi:hypothetical protein